MLEWTDQNSKGNVSVKLFTASKKEDKWVVDETHGLDCAFFAFEKSDDALFFRIKYGSL